MAKNINEIPFDNSTKLKLNIIGECFREWLPVFIHNPSIDRIYIYDFFAGSGTDSEGFHGSPLLLIEQAKGNNCSICESVGLKQVSFIFNEFIKDKSVELENTIETHVNNCLIGNCKKPQCVYKRYYPNFKFEDIFKSENLKAILNNKRYAKFILLDQYGFSQVNESIF